ncbi:MAG: hypothetical protein KDI65_02760, partial [Alphaproteobacteria bacterium]|nr:hypothetical protein [Alphaproteobacteria bacterium]
MSKNLTQSFRFDITSDEQFYTLANAFTHALRAVEQQGYAVEYNGETLHHPGQIGISGRSGIGKSAFFNAVMTAFLPGVMPTQKLQPSANETRMVQVWKQWLQTNPQKEYRVEDMHAKAALIHMPEMHLPLREVPGVTVFEHPDDKADYCDLMMSFAYDGEGRRIAQIRTTEATA